MFYWETITTCINGKHLPQGLFTMIRCMCRFMPKSVCGPVMLSTYHRQNKSLMKVFHSCSDDGMGLCLYV